MAPQATRLPKSLAKFIADQSMFFVATAAPEGRVNMSPKGLDTLRVLSDRQIVWLSLTGSGNETAAHILQQPRMTLMFCAFTGTPMILRVYGSARGIHPRDPDWPRLLALFPDYASARTIFCLDIELVTTSCGSGVPEMTMMRDRGATELDPWYREMGADGVRDFWHRKNRLSLDGDPTGIFEA